MSDLSHRKEGAIVVRGLWKRLSNSWPAPVEDSWSKMKAGVRAITHLDSPWLINFIEHSSISMIKFFDQQSL